MTRAHDAGRRCRCQSEHRPAPLELERHHVWPLAMGGSDDPSNVEWLCPTAHMNVHELMRFLLNGTLTTYADALRMYEQPVSRHAWAVAVEGVRRFREGERGRVEAVLERHMTVPPREFDAKTQAPHLAHERCKVPNCSLRPWGLGTVTPEEPRYCPAHQAISDLRDDLRDALRGGAA